MALSHSARSKFWQTTREILGSVALHVLVMGFTVGPIYLVICLLRDDSAPGCIAWVPGFVRQYGTLLFVLAAGATLVLYGVAHKLSAKPDDQDQPDPPES